MQCVPIPHTRLDAPTVHQRLDGLQRADAGFLQWFVSKYSKKRSLCFYCHNKGIVVNIHERYRDNVKNVGKSNFDVLGSHKARASFMTWAVANEIDLYIRNNKHALDTEYEAYKCELYRRYKKNVKRKAVDDTDKTIKVARLGAKELSHKVCN